MSDGYQGMRDMRMRNKKTQFKFSRYYLIYIYVFASEKGHCSQGCLFFFFSFEVSSTLEGTGLIYILPVLWGVTYGVLDKRGHATFLIYVYGIFMSFCKWTPKESPLADPPLLQLCLDHNFSDTRDLAIAKEKNRLSPYCSKMNC